MAERSKRESRGKSRAGRVAPATRQLAVRVKTAKKRDLASTLWLERQLNDPYVAEAKRLGYRSRAAFKLAQLDEKYRLIRPGMRIVDLGAAPGGWTQIAVERARPSAAAGRIVALDILPMDEVAPAIVLHLDFLAADAPKRLVEALGGPADLVMSDMAAPTTGHRETDHIRIIALAEAAYDFAAEVLAPKGAFVAKVFQGGSERELLARLKRDFETVRHAKPPASRAESSEVYVVAQGFRGVRHEAERS
ncbi:MAG TPA: RlmE family RNA methyltransferase [Alphaproteobacteria bacterium]|nr:RlmE family RNA methyltransferase [Alphaproteobacteria bacterium]